MGTRRVGRLLASGAALSILVPLLATPPSGAAKAHARQRFPEAHEIRTVWTSEFGIPRPTGLAFDPGSGELLVAEARGGSTKVLRLGLDEDPRGTFRLPGVADPSTLAFDPLGGRLTAVSGGEQISAAGPRLGRLSRTDISGLGLRAPAGATFDPSTGTWYVLDRAALAVLRVPAAGSGSAARISLRGLGAARLGGIAFDPSDGLLYASDPGRELLFALDGTGTVRKTYDLGALDLRSPGAMTFAPSADRTDDPDTMHLYVADAGDRSWLGGVTEVSLAPAVVALAETVTATLVQVIDTSAWNPASPDPAGITYIPSTDHLMVADSEVDETTGAGFHGVNLWRSTRAGTVVDTGDLTPWTREPTGLGYDGATNTLFVSTDSGNRIYIMKPGGDGRFGTTDDVVSSISTGTGDTEDPEFDPATGHLFFVDGISTEVYRIDPVDGVFANGNDVMTHFDVGVHGAKDTEGLGSDQARGTLLVGDRTQKKIYEVTKTGDLVRIIDASGISGMRFLSGLTMAPASNGSGAMNYWIVDRAIDNGPDPNENDGKIFEIAVPSSGDAPPTVQITSPAAGATVSGTVQIEASASDDQGVTQVEFRIDGGPLSTDTTAPYQASWNTTTVGDGQHTITAIATDTIGQVASASRAVTVDNVDDPPTVQITSPASGATVSGTVQVQASASDDVGVTQVRFFDGATPIGTDTDGSNGWSAPWDTTAVPAGAHSLSAVATDTASQSTTSAAVDVTVDNTPVVDVAIATGSDDAEERSTGSVTLTSGDLDLLLDGTDLQRAVGLRFVGVNVPQGANVTNAYVQFQADEASSEATNLVIRGQAADNAPPFTTTSSNITSRAVTGASVAWAPAAWTSVGARGPAQRTPNLAPVLGEILARPGWAPGNALVLILTGSGRRVAESFEGAFAPVLHIEYGQGDAPPTVQITSPAAGATVSGTVQIAASASDDQGVTQVEFRIDGALLSTDTTAPYQASWNTTTVGDGQHTITAVATDTANQSTTSAGVGVTVDNTDDPPTVQVTSPLSGAKVSGTVQIAASASDDQGVTQVEFRIDGAPLSTDTTAPYQASWNTTTVGDGQHTITAVATDTANQSTTSAGVGVTVDNTAPSVQVTSPASGATVSGTIAVTANASDASGVGSVMFLLDGSTVLGTDTDGSNGWSVSWNTATTGNGNHQLTAVAADVAGNSATSAPVQVTVDNPLVLDIPIAVSLGDVEEKANGNIIPASSDLDMVNDNQTVQRGVGLRFTGINVPNGATIVNAYVQFQVDKATSIATSLTVHGEASDNAAAFVQVKYNLTSRARTTASIVWTPPAWTTVGARGPDQRTPQLKPVLEEILARPGWAPGNALVLIITGTGERVAEAFDGTFAPVLHIEYAIS